MLDVERLVDRDRFFAAVFAATSVGGAGQVQMVSAGGFHAARFADGLIVDPFSCPRRVFDRAHWDGDGRCGCPRPGR